MSCCVKQLGIQCFFEVNCWATFIFYCNFFNICKGSDVGFYPNYDWDFIFHKKTRNSGRHAPTIVAGVRCGQNPKVLASHMTQALDHNTVPVLTMLFFVFTLWGFVVENIPKVFSVLYSIQDLREIVLRICWWHLIRKRCIIITFIVWYLGR